MASDIFKRLEASPNEEFLSKDQVEAARWLADLGLAASLPPDWETKPFIGVNDSCKTHWIAVRIVRGDEAPRTDGLYISFIPRSKISGEDLKRLLLKTFGGTPTIDRPPR